MVKVKIIGVLNLEATSSTKEVTVQMIPQIEKKELEKNIQSRGLEGAQLGLVSLNEQGKEFLYYLLAMKRIENLEGFQKSIPNIPFELKIY